MDHQKYQREYIEENVDSMMTDKELVWRLLRYLRPYRALLITAIGFLLFSKVIEVSVPIFIGRLAQAIMDPGNLDEAQKTLLLQHVLESGFYILGLLLLSYLLDSGNVILRSWIGQKGLYRLRKRIYDYVMQMPLSFFNKHTVGRLMTRTIHDVDQINQMFADSVIPIIGNFFLFIGIFVGMVIVDWRIAVLVMAVLPLLWWLTSRFRRFQRICYNRIRTVVSAMNTFVQEHLMGASIIRNFGLQSRTKKEFEAINEDYCDVYVESIHHFSFFIAGIDLIQNGSLILAFAVIILFSPIGSSFDVGTFMTFSLYSLMFFRPLADLAERYNVLQSAMAAAARIFHLLDSDSEKKMDTGSLHLDEIESIVFEDVWFAYEDENWVLKGLSLGLYHGHSYAFVGMTGAGKSSIMSLLLRFYEPQKGTIQINGISIQKYSLSSLRQQFSVVLQDPVIFSGTVIENLSLFDEAITRERVQSVVDYLGLQSWTAHFPQGLDQMLHEQGKGLSVGEMQLISLARAIVHRRSVLILDEATANVDAMTEQAMQQAFHQALASRKMIALVIAHRLPTVKEVTNIIVLQAGKVAEEGSHQALLERQGIYEKLYRLFAE